MTTVWVMHPVSQDIRSAERWGGIRYVNGGNVKPHRDLLTYVYEDTLVGADRRLPLAMGERMNAAANEFDPANDYVLLVGDHILLMQFVFFLANKGKAPRLLRWDRHAHGYYSAQLVQASTTHRLTRRPGRAGVDVQSDLDWFNQTYGDASSQ